MPDLYLTRTIRSLIEFADQASVAAHSAGVADIFVALLPLPGATNYHTAVGLGFAEGPSRQSLLPLGDPPVDRGTGSFSMTTATSSNNAQPVTGFEQIMSGVYEVEHPLIQCHLTRLRDESTPPSTFRQAVRRLATLLAYEATKDLPCEPTPVKTPLTETTGSKLRQRVGLIPILRAGLGMVDPVLDLIPSAEVWHLGLYRDEATAQPVKYYSKLPPGRAVDVALVVDPMLATGGSAAAALQTLSEWGVSQLKVLSIIASEEGIKALEAEFPDAQIFVCQIDPELNANKFIVPGLGDAGDRIFNTPG